LAPQFRARGDRPQLRRPLRLHRLRLRHGGEIGPPLPRKIRRAGRLHAGELAAPTALSLHLEALTLHRRAFLSAPFLSSWGIAGLATRAVAAEPHDVVIVGAGIAGLTAARAIASAGKKVVLVEARQRIGGRVFTDTDMGFAFDHGAPTQAVPQGAGAVIVRGKELSKEDYEKYEKTIAEVEKKIELVHRQLPGVDPKLA